MSISIRTVAGVVRAWYASVAIGQIERFERRGHSRPRAESQTALVLAATSMCNLLSVLALLGWTPRSDLLTVWAGAVVGLFLLERLHLVAMRGWIRAAERTSTDYAARARRSNVYIAVSLLGLLAAGAYVLA